MRKLLVVALAFALTVTVAANPTYGASGPRLAQAGSESLTAEEAGRLAGHYLGLRQLWLDLAADSNWDDDGSEQSDITALTDPFKTALVGVLANYFEGHVQTPPAISGKTVDIARGAASTAAFSIVNFEKSSCTGLSHNNKCIYRNRGTVYNHLDDPRPPIRYTNWDTFYNTLLDTATTEWGRKCSFVVQVERLRDLYTAISEAWPASTARSALDDMFNGTSSTPSLDNDIKLNIDRGISGCLTAPQAGLMVGQYINLQQYWKELIGTRTWKNIAVSDNAKVDAVSADVKKHIENVITDYFEWNIETSQDGVEVSGPASRARSAAQDALAITDPDPVGVRGDIYVKLGSPWPQDRYDAWDGFYNSLSDAAKDDIPKSMSYQKLGRLLGLYTKLYNATPSQDRSGLDTMFNALTADIGTYMDLNRKTMIGSLSNLRGDAELTGCIDCPPLVALISARFYLFVRGASLQQLQDAFGTNMGSKHRILFRKWYLFYDAFKEAAG